MPVISEGTLGLLQGIAEDAMLDTVTITGAGTTATTASGGWTVEPGAAVVTKGRIGPLSKASLEQVKADRQVADGLEELSIPKNVAVSADDTLTVTSARHGGTRTFTIEGVAPLGTYAVQRTLIVKPMP